MGYEGDLRSVLEKIADMLPLSDREAELAWLIFHSFESVDLEAFHEEPDWYGRGAGRAVHWLEKWLEERA